MRVRVCAVLFGLWERLWLCVGRSMCACASACAFIASVLHALAGLSTAAYLCDGASTSTRRQCCVRAWAGGAAPHCETAGSRGTAQPGSSIYREARRSPIQSSAQSRMQPISAFAQRSEQAEETAVLCRCGLPRQCPCGFRSALATALASAQAHNAHRLKPTRTRVHNTEVRPRTYGHFGQRG